jgi:ech hydrogenase subunit B
MNKIMLMKTLSVVCYILFAPIIGGLLAGIDRIISARLQRRIGPPVFQPFYDVLKLFQKENSVVRRSQNYYILLFFLFAVFSGALFFWGGDLLLVIFALTLANIFFILGAYKGSSPYSFMGAERELLQMLSYEPMVLIVCVAFYMITGSFRVEDILQSNIFVLKYLPGVFLGFVLILVVKFRKSPFDLSMSHHAHQEIVKGIVTEYNGFVLGAIEMIHWYESIMLLGIFYLFFPTNLILGFAVSLIVFFFIILVDNVFARLKWQWMVKNIWIFTLILGFGNIAVIYILKYFKIIF